MGITNQSTNSSTQFATVETVKAMINMLKLSFKFAEARQTTCYVQGMKDGQRDVA